VQVTFPIRSDKLTMTVEVSRTVASERSAFQQIDVLESEVFGRMLLLDGHIQLTTFDEAAYHEYLVQVPMLNLPGARRALVVGGGDGGVLRELVKHPRVERIDMVEIADAVVRVSREHLPTVSAGAFDDPRVRLVIGDAFAFVQGDEGPYDLVVVDSTDVYEDEEGELSEALFTEGFYSDVRRLLAPGGLVVTQADNLVFCPYSLEEVRELLGRVFARVGSYWGPVPSFGGYSGYCWASMDGSVSPDWPGSAVPARFLSERAYATALAPLPFGV
jgi:spermidine synthase